MSSISMTKCDGCGKVVENHHQQAGWIHFTVTSGITISRSVGIWDAKIKNYRSPDYITNVSDFCSLDCLESLLNKNRLARESL